MAGPRGQAMQITRASGFDADADGAAHAGAADAAVAARILRQVLLVVVLGVVELGRVDDLGGDRAVAGALQLGRIGLARRLGRLALRVAVDVERAAILRAGVAALAHALRRIVVLPEHAQELVVRDLLRVEHDAHHLGVTGGAGADFAVGRVRREAALVADRRRVDARLLPELALGAPEAAEAEVGDLEAVGARRRQSRAVDEVDV